MAKSKAYRLFPKETGGTLPWKMVSETQIDLGKVFNQLKIWKTHAAADDAVMIFNMTSGVQFDPKNSG